MFNTKKSDTASQGNGQAISPISNNSIVVGTKIDGNVTANSDIRIDGELYGNLQCNGKVVIGPEGRLIGDINCINAVIEGKFSGKLVCTELLNVRETATIDGEIKTDKLIVQSGAVFNVTCQMGAFENFQKNGKLKEAYA